MLISTSAASALWTGSRRLRAVSGASPGGPLNLANSHPLAIPRGGQLGDSLAHECGEAAAYGFVYAIAAALTGGVADRADRGRALQLQLHGSARRGEGGRKNCGRTMLQRGALSNVSLQ